VRFRKLRDLPETYRELAGAEYYDQRLVLEDFFDGWLVEEDRLKKAYDFFIVEHLNWSRHFLTEEQWETIKDHLSNPELRKPPGKGGTDC